MDCKRYLELLDDGGEGCLDAAIRAEFVAHGERCPACRRAHAAVARALDGVRALAPGEAVAAAFAERVIRRLAPSVGPARQGSPGGSGTAAPGGSGVGRPLSWLALVAGVVGALLMGGIVWLAWSGSVVEGPSMPDPRRSAGVTGTGSGGDAGANGESGSWAGEPRVPSLRPASDAAPVGAPEPTLQPPILARVTGKVGVNAIRRRDADGGIRVGAEATLTVSPSLPVRIELAGGAVVELAGSFRLRVQDLATARLENGSGRLRFPVRGAPVTVRLPHCEFAVLGTEVHVAIADDADAVWVATGTVRLSAVGANNTETLVGGQGRRVAAAGRQPLARSPLPAVGGPGAGAPTATATSDVAPVAASATVSPAGTLAPATSDAPAPGSSPASAGIALNSDDGGATASVPVIGTVTGVEAASEAGPAAHPSSGGFLGGDDPGSGDPTPDGG